MPHSVLWRTIAIAAVTVCLTLPTVGAAQATAGSVTGFVYDDADGEGLIRATIVVEGLAIGTLTNAQGYYVLPKVPGGTTAPGVHLHRLRAAL